MNRFMRWLGLGLSLLLPLLFGCGGGSTTLQPKVELVMVSPQAVILGGSETQQFVATVTGTTNTAVTWTLSDCSGAACGTISSSGLYTAPSLIVNQATVTVIATSQADTKMSGRATVGHTPLSVEVSPAGSLYVGARGTQAFTASISRHPNPDVSWSLSGTGCAGEGCGTLTDITNNSVTYHAPAAVPNEMAAMVKATSVADDTKSQTVSVNLMPISVSVTPGPQAAVGPSSTGNFRAAVQYDPENAGVTWSLSGAGCSGDACGTVSDATSSSAVYHAPAVPPDPPTVVLTATSVTDTTHSATSTITVSNAASALQGKYAFLIRGYRREPGELWLMAGHFDADGNGNLTGVWDANRGPTPEQAQTISGSYAIQPDGRGIITIQAGTGLTFNLTMDELGNTARLAEDTRATAAQIPVPDSYAASGLIVRQDSASFALSSVAGDRVLALSGELTGSPVAALGRFTSGSGGVLSAGVVDLTWQGNTNAFTTKTGLSGTFGAPDSSTGRGTASLATGQGVFNFAYYIVSNRSILLVQTDARGIGVPTLSGEVRLQTGAGAFANTSLNAPVIFNLTGTIGLSDGLSDFEAWIFGASYPGIAVGEVLPNGAGWLAVTYDQNEAGIATSNGTGSGDYTVEPNGRVAMSLPTAVNPGATPSTNAVAYLTDQNSGYLIRGNYQGADFGWFEPQTSGSFDLSALSGTFLFNTGLPTTVESLNSSGLLTLGEDGKAVATLSGPFGNFSGTLFVEPGGRGTLTFTMPSTTTSSKMVLWPISPERCVGLMTADQGFARPALVLLERLK